MKHNQNRYLRHLACCRSLLQIQILHKNPKADHILFLEKKNYAVTPCTNGADALQIVKQESFDIVFLDENMPGLSGLETLAGIKVSQPNLPVIMITKSEEAQVLLHHILIQSGHYDGNKCPADKVFEKMILLVPVSKNPDIRIGS